MTAPAIGVGAVTAAPILMIFVGPWAGPACFLVLALTIVISTRRGARP